MKVAMTGYEISLESGVGKFILKVGGALKAAGHDTHYIASKASPDVARNQSVHFVQQGIDPNRAPRSYIEGHTEHSRQVEQMLSTIGADVLFRNEFAPVRNDVFATHLVYPAWLKAFERSKQYFSPKFRKNMEIESSRVYHLYSERVQVESARLIVALSGQCASDMVSHYGIADERMVRVYNGADLSEFYPVSDEYRGELRTKFGIKPHETVLVFTGFNFDRKGLLPLLMAMKIVVGNNKAVQLLIAGSPRGDFFREAASSLGVEDHVRFLDSLTTDAVRQLLNASDIFVLPSFYDPCPLVVSEAIACGVPMVISRQVGQSDFLIDGLHSEVVDDPRDIESLADAIQRLTGDELRRETMRATLLQLSTVHQWDSTTTPIVGAIGKVFD